MNAFHNGCPSRGSDPVDAQGPFTSPSPLCMSLVTIASQISKECSGQTTETIELSVLWCNHQSSQCKPEYEAARNSFRVLININ